MRSTSTPPRCSLLELEAQLIALKDSSLSNRSCSHPEDDHADDTSSCSSGCDHGNFEADFSNADASDDEDSVATTQSEANRKLRETRLRAKALLEIEKARIKEQESMKSDRFTKRAPASLTVRATEQQEENKAC